MTGVFSKLRSAATKRRVHSLIDAGWSCFVQKALLRKRPPIHPLSLLTVLFAVGVATLLLPYLVEVAEGRFMQARPATFGAILYVGIFPSLLSYFFFNRSVELIGTARAGVYMNLPPVFGVGLAILLLGEHIERFHAIGAALVAIGVVYSTRNSGGARVAPVDARQPR